MLAYLKPLNHIFKKEKDILILIGKTFGHIEQSCFLKASFQYFDLHKIQILNFFFDQNGVLKTQFSKKQLAKVFPMNLIAKLKRINVESLFTL